MNKRSASGTRSETTAGSTGGGGGAAAAAGRESFERCAAEATRLWGTWEKAATEAAERAARDPRALALGSAMLRSQLLAGKAMGLMWEAALAPWEALVQEQH